jgi:hypothetical protein
MSESKSLSLARLLITGCCSATPTPYEQQPPHFEFDVPFIVRLFDGNGGLCRYMPAAAMPWSRLLWPAACPSGRSVLALHILGVYLCFPNVAR